MAPDIRKHTFNAENAGKFAKIWEDEGHREKLFSRLAETVGDGKSILTDEEFARLVGEGCLGLDQVSECYYQIRERIERSEDEWRPEFEAIFPDYRDQLPLMVSQAVLDECVDVLVIGIIGRNPETVEHALRHANEFKIDLHAIKGLAPESFQAQYPVFCDEDDDDAMDVLEFAEMAGNEKVIRLIKKALRVDETKN
ncbi:MAG: hypothetical protein ACFCD0_16145 [Gemmataceae bacterium]